MSRFDPPPTPDQQTLARIESAISALVDGLQSLSLPVPQVSVTTPEVPAPRVDVTVPTEGLVDAVVRAVNDAVAALPPLDAAGPTVVGPTEAVLADGSLTPLVEAAEQQRSVLEALQEKLSNLTGGTRSHFDGRLRNDDGRPVSTDHPLPVNIADAAGDGRIDYTNSLTTPLGNTETFTGEWQTTDGMGALSFFAFSDEPFSALRLEWSDDGENVVGGLLSTADYLTSEEVDPGSGLYVYYPDPQTYLLHDYYRVVMENNTGTGQNIMEAYLWTFPAGSQPFAFLDVDGVPSTLQKALLTKPVNPALEIAYFSDAVDGALPSGSLPTIDPVLNTEPNVLDTGWIDTSTFAGKNVVGVLADCSLQVFLMNATDTAGDNIFGDGAPTLVTQANFPAQLSALYADRYYRMLIVNTSGTTCTSYRAYSNAAPESTEGVTTAIEQPVFGFFPANVNRSVVMGRQPDGDYVNVPATGLAHDVDGVAITTTTTLGAAATYQSGWVDTDGWDEIELVVKADQVSGDEGVVIDFTDDSGAATPTTRITRRFTYGADDVSEGGLVVRVPPRLDGFRISYTNGGTAQGSFFLGVTLRADATALARTEIGAQVNETAEAITTKGVITVRDGTSGSFVNVGGTEVSGDEGLNTYVLGGEVGIAPLSSWTSRLHDNVTSTPIEVTSSSPLTGRKTVTIKASVANNKECHVGPTAAVSTSSAALRPGEVLVLELDETAEVWVRSATGSQTISVVEIA